MAGLAQAEEEELAPLESEADFGSDERLETEDMQDFGDQNLEAGDIQGFGDQDLGNVTTLEGDADWSESSDLSFDEPLDAGDIPEIGDSEPLAEGGLGLSEPLEPDDLGFGAPAAQDEAWAEDVLSENLEPMEEEFAPIDWNEEDLTPLEDAEGGSSFITDDTNGFHQDTPPAPEPPDATDDFIHKFAPVSPEEVDQRTPGSAKASGSNLKTILSIGAGALALLLAVFGITTLLGRMRQPDAPVTQPPTEIPAPPDGGTTPPTEPTAPPTQPPVTPPVSANPFRDAVNAATQASQLAQAATTKEDWQAVADAWENAITLMQQVPESDPNYATAQDRAQSYQPNLTYAQQNVQRFP
jgi:hypothetical protein